MWNLNRKVFNWVIQIVPQIDPDLKEIIIKHKLFQKCILVYGQVLPTLDKFLKEKSFGKMLQLFFMITYRSYNQTLLVTHLNKIQTNIRDQQITYNRQLMIQM